MYFSPCDHTPNHFFASSTEEWKTGTDLPKLIKSMKTSRMTFSIWYVPVAEDSSYLIEQYAPQVEGAVQLGFVG